jgi:hypothetical protein
VTAVATLVSVIVMSPSAAFATGIEIKLNSPATKAIVAVLETDFLNFTSNIEPYFL